MTLRFAREHNRSHPIADAKDHTAGNHKLFHSNGSGELVELSLGEANEILTAMGASAAPEFIAGIPKENQIINGDFNLWQRGTSFAAIASGTFGPDRLEYYKNGSFVHTLARSTDIPTFAQSGHNSQYSMYLDCTTGLSDPGWSTTNYCILTYAMEGYDLANLLGRTVALSFWVKATKTGTFCVAFRNSAFDRSYIAEYTINTTATWEKKTITLDLDEATGTWGLLGNVGVLISFTIGLAQTSNYHTTKDAWQTGNYMGTTSQQNGCNLDSYDFRLSQVKLEGGGIVSPFRDLDITKEIARCQRYFEKSYSIWDAPGTYGVYNGCAIMQSGSTKLYLPIAFNTQKRTEATIVVYSPESPGSAGAWYDWTAIAEDTVGLNTSRGTRGFYASNGSTTADHLYGFQWTADAEL
jgi:hypothetical protein